MSYCVHPAVMESAELRGLRTFRPTHRQMIAFDQHQLSHRAGTLVGRRLREITDCAPPVGLRKERRS